MLPSLLMASNFDFQTDLNVQNIRLRPRVKEDFEKSGVNIIICIIISAIWY